MFMSGFSSTGTCNSTGFAPNTELVCVFYFWKASSPQYIKSSLIVPGDLFIFARFGCCFFLLFCPHLYYVHGDVNLCKCGLVYLTNQFHFWCVFPFLLSNYVTDVSIDMTFCSTKNWMLLVMSVKWKRLNHNDGLFQVQKMMLFSKCLHFLWCFCGGFQDKSRVKATIWLMMKKLLSQSKVNQSKCSVLLVLGHVNTA